MLRQIEVAFHAFFGVVALVAALLAIVSNKGDRLHRNAGKAYFVSVIGLLLTSFISFLIVRMFPFFLVGYMAFYLSISAYKAYFSNRIFTGILTALANLVAVFFIYSGIKDHNYILSLWGVAFGYFSVLDTMVHLNIQKPKALTRLTIAHFSRMLCSYYFVIMAFLVSQFSNKEFEGKFFFMLILPMLLIIVSLSFFYYRYRNAELIK
jgi:uncharacterized membrane protein